MRVASVERASLKIINIRDERVRCVAQKCAGTHLTSSFSESDGLHSPDSGDDGASFSRARVAIVSRQHAK